MVRFSDSGTTARIKEEETFMYFVDYLDDCERCIYHHCDLKLYMCD